MLPTITWHYTINESTTFVHLMHKSQHQVAQSQNIKLAQGNQAVLKLHAIRGMVRLWHGKMSKNGRARVVYS